MSVIIDSNYLREFIKSNEIPFKATQAKLCVPIIKRLYNKMFHGIKFDDIKVCDNLIIDGHHRYLSSLIIGINIGRVHSHKTSATRPVTWDNIEFDDSDWDTFSKISYLNEQDAVYNGVDVEVVKQIVFGSKK